MHARQPKNPASMSPHPALFALCGLAITAATVWTHPTLAQQPAAAAPTTAAGAGPQLSATIRDGGIEVVERGYPNTSVKWGRATAVVDAPTTTVMRIVQDYGKYSEFLPHFRVSRVLTRRGANALVYLQASVIRNTTTLWSQMRIFQRRSQGATQIVEGQMVQGNVERMAARWEITPMEGGRRTLVSFQFIIEPDLPFPASIFTEQNVRAARRTLEALRRRVAEPRFAALRAP